MSDIRMAKFETIMEDINNVIEKKGGIKVVSISGKVTNKKSNSYLALIYDYDKLNEYGKIIMDKSKIDCTNGIRDLHRLPWDERWNASEFYNNTKSRIDAAKDFVQECRKITNTSEAYKFIFWALMILTVDKNNAEEHLSVICDFARMLNISNEELLDIICVIKIIYNELEKCDGLKCSDKVISIFGEVFKMY